jgi:hypothetical protein
VKKMIANNAFEPERLAWKPSEIPVRLTRQRVKARTEVGQCFLKGPIPWAWLQRATPLRGKALAVGLVLWFLKGLRKQSTVRLEPSKVRSLGLSRRQCYLGSAPDVTILAATESSGAEPC